ncbi:ATP-binding cassette domain-containing protein [bacterium]|nr:MAG: ATP-binding cassette domain-containing protein [bacterium]
MSDAVRLAGITKRFGGVTALQDVSLAVPTGTMHAIVGENGAGKTTLMRVLYGAIRPDEGFVEVEGSKRDFHTSADAIRSGIGMVSQHYGVVTELSNLQNLILGAEGGPFLDLPAAERRAQELAERMGYQFDWRASSAELSPAGQQKLEILKLLWRGARTMILDEPTAMLSPQDGEALFQSLRSLVDAGSTVLLVTHRLPEVMDYCQGVTVLRAGERVADMPVAETNASELARLIVGGGEIPHETLEPAPTGETVFRIRGLAGGKLKGADLEIRTGELVGLAGVDGSGQRELFRAVAGIERAKAGTIELFGSDAAPMDAAERLKRGLRTIPEDRHDEAVIEDWSLVQNAALGLQRDERLTRGGRIDLARLREWAEKVAKRFSTRHGGLDLPMASLSGGNQQRFVAARALESEPRLILAFQPARGLDLLGTAEVYGAIRERCRDGAAAIVVSFDLDELLEHCDRIVAISDGRISEPPADKARDRDAIGRLMTGAAA